MTDHDSIISRELQALNSLNAALPKLLDDAMSREQLDEIIAKQLFSPSNDEQIAYWFARFISINQNLWDIVDTAISLTGGTSKLVKGYDWHYFVLAYSAICSLVRMDRFLLTKVAYHTIIQRKLNEPFPEHRIRRKQYKKIYSALVLPANAIRIHQAHRLFKKKRNVIAQEIQSNKELVAVFDSLPKQERYIDLSWRRYFIAWIFCRKHAWLRRGASAQQKSKFAVLEYGGRFVSELMLPRPKKVTTKIRNELAAMLRPGDIFITRHNQALTNLLLPGFWPHAALYVGYDIDRASFDNKPDKQYLNYWRGENCTFEALKDGVRFRSLQDTLNVDAFVVLRPNLSNSLISEAIARVVTHVGKGYNFDFDFFRSDRLVCTELVYRAFDGIGGYQIPLAEHMGMKTVSAEDLLDLVLDTNWGKAIAIYGVGEFKHRLCTGDKVDQVLAASYR